MFCSIYQDNLSLLIKMFLSEILFVKKSLSGLHVHESYQIIA